MNNLRTLHLLILAVGVVHTAAAQYLSGYGHEHAGETIKYESQQPDATQALLVRSENSKKYIEWFTDTIPGSFNADTVKFILIAGIDVNAEDNHGFKMILSDREEFSFRNPLDTLETTWHFSSPGGVSLDFNGVMIDKYGDLFGYMFLSVPKSVYTPGEPLKIRVTGESAGSRSWFMVFKYTAVRNVKFIQEEALVKTGSGEKQLLRIDILHFDDPTEATIRLGENEQTMPLSLGFNMLRMDIPKVDTPTTIRAVVTIGGQQQVSEDLLIHPVKKKTIYLLPHSHNDIGYTHVQEEVERIQHQNMREAIRFSLKTKEYPAGSQFKWNTEVVWAIKSYYDQCSESERAEFIQAVQDGRTEINGLYANVLTGLCRPEELVRMMKAGHDLAATCHVRLESAMITDIPGYTWSLVPIMAQSGIRYFSIGTNTFHRIGDIIETWGDKPFYWESPSGNEKILCWVHGKGYSEFHTGLAYTKLRNKLKEQIIFDYIGDLAKNNYPYDLVTMRYNIGSDNGPPDPYLSDIVKSWNERYSSPRLVISTVSESFGLFEAAYGDQLPVVRGDLTGYWEDGAASSARETALNIAAAERLTQASLFYSLYQPDRYPEQLFDSAWEKVLLYSEHTWGSWNSISEPHSEFTLQQWKTKQSFALDADKYAHTLLNQALPEPAVETVSEVDVFNSCSWMRSDVVAIPASLNLRGDRIVDDAGRIIPSQRLLDGSLVFYAENIPAFGNRRYRIQTASRTDPSGDETNDISHPYPHIEINIDPETGVINRLLFKKYDMELVNQESAQGLNEYIYVSGRDPEKRNSNQENISIRIIEDGPVLKTISIQSQATGVNSLERRITLFKDIDRVDITNRVDKTDVLDQEAIHFRFPFSISDPTVHVSNALGYYQIQNEQLPGSNLNYLTANRWVDVSGGNKGITWVPINAPLIEVGEIRCDPIDYGWIDSLPQSSVIYSYVMNNYWETNYKASQPGTASFSYSIVPHNGFNPVEAEKTGKSRHQPLIVRAADRFTRVPDHPFEDILSGKILVESMIPMSDGILIRLYNPAMEQEKIVFGNPEGEKMFYLCDPFGGHRIPATSEILLDARDVAHIFIGSSAKEIE